MSSDAAERSPTAIVGIGASAGGIAAMRRFLSATPSDSGLGFVLVMHLQSGHASHLAEVLRNATDLSVVEIVDGQMVRPDTLHVIPPDAKLEIEDGRLRLHPVHSVGQAGRIDDFFRALAADQGDRGICAILAGAGSDGALGLRAVREHGGLALTARIPDDQPPGELTAQDSMPRAAAATGLADYIVPIEEMPQLALDYARHVDRMYRETDVEGLQRAIEDQLPAIRKRILERTGHDLRQYKPATLMRRIQRRMQALRLADPADYAARLDAQPEEVDALHRDILIGVTSFFRDPEAFAALEHRVIPQLLANARESGTSVRVWVPACGTGEEAYSIAMLLHEGMEHSGHHPEVQVFGTDVDSQAIQHARLGLYSHATAESVPTRLHERYLAAAGDSLRVVQAIREMCLFSEHDLNRHPPFSRLDLISCRNLLIYLDTDLQGRLIPLFHYVLRPQGILFLGSSETLGKHQGLFEDVDKKHRIFRRREHVRTRVPAFPISTGGYRVPHLGVQPARRDEDARSRLTRKAERTVLEQFGPAYVVADVDHNAVHFAPGVGRYLEPPVGAPRSNVLDMARSGLRPALRRALRRAAETGGSVSDPAAELTVDGQRRRVELFVRPVQERSGEERLFLIVFRDAAQTGEAAPADAPAETAAPAEGDASTTELERELADTKSDLQATIEELEASNEELQSANEELLSMNEELQSSNEELESSKEELQSVNEELETVNDELRSKVDELNRTNADLRNLIHSTQIATVFLDREQRIKWFTPNARRLFNLISSDVDRPFSDISGKLETPPERELAQVMETEQPIERQVRLTDGSETFVMRVLPYRTSEGQTDGLVLTFVDITQLRAATADLSSVLDLLPVGTALTRDAEAARVRINRTGARLLGLTADDTEIGPDRLRQLFDRPDGDGAADLPLCRAARDGEQVADEQGTVRAVGGHGVRRAVLMSARPLGEAGEPPRGAIMAFADVSELKTAQHRQELLLRALQHRVRNMLANIRAMANATLSNSDGLADFEERFEGRLNALALTENIIARTGRGSVDLEELASEILLPALDSQTIVLDGPNVALEPRAAQMLALALNELKTNAIKHGTIAEAEGRIVLRWGQVADRADNQLLRLRWQESGVGESTRTGGGFGRELIERGVPHELGGSASWAIEDGVLTCLIDLPMQRHVLSIGEADGDPFDATDGAADDRGGPADDPEPS